jgi:dipeptidyl aminopeptidase/acylaminoacyl peptidase
VAGWISAVVAILASLLALGASPAAAASPHDDAWIAFTRWSGPVTVELALARPGEEPTVVESRVYRLSWSPDGRHLAYTTDDGGGTRATWVVRPGSAPFRLARGTFLVWSPDGLRLAGTRTVGGQAETAVAHLFGGRVDPVTRHDSGVFGWSPDGRWLGLHRSSSVFGGSVWAVPASGGSPVRLTQGDDASSPSWSPKENVIAFHRAWDGSVYTVPGDGSGPPRRITSPGEGSQDAYPEWAPDGRRLAFVRSHFLRGDELRTVDPDGGPTLLLGTGSFPTKWSTWSPNGARLMVIDATWIEEGDDVPCSYPRHDALVASRSGSTRVVIEDVGATHDWLADSRALVVQRRGPRTGEPCRFGTPTIDVAAADGSRRIPLSSYSGATPAPPDPRVDQIVRLYEAAFLRAPDPGGLAHWLAQYRGGRSLPAIATDVAASSELRARFGPLDDRAYVRQLYLNVLRREPDVAGWAFWERALRSGASRGWVMVGFSDSAELVSRTGTVPPR